MVPLCQHLLDSTLETCHQAARVEAELQKEDARQAREATVGGYG